MEGDVVSDHEKVMEFLRGLSVRLARIECELGIAGTPDGPVGLDPVMFDGKQVTLFGSPCYFTEKVPELGKILGMRAPHPDRMPEFVEPIALPEGLQGNAPHSDFDKEPAPVTIKPGYKYGGML
jgi:hypothetical protein